MTMPRTVSTCCSVCKKRSSHMALASSSTFGTPDLDLLISSMYGDEYLLVLKADIMRRAGMFQALIDTYRDIVILDPVLEDLARFHISLAQKGDARCYTMEDARDAIRSISY